MKILELQSYLAGEADDAGSSDAGYEHCFFLDLRLSSTVDVEQGAIFCFFPFQRRSLP